MYSPLFLVQETSRKWCPVLDLRYMSLLLKQQSFHMESFKTITTVIQRNNWMISIGLENAYFHIPVAKNHQHYLRFHFKGSHFEFRCLPFWPLFSPKNLFKSSSNSCRLSSGKGHSYIPLSGQRPCPGPVQEASHTTPRSGAAHPGGIWVDGELRKKPVHSFSEPCIPGYGLQHDSLQDIPSRGQD